MAGPIVANPLVLAAGAMVLLGMLHTLASALRNAKAAHRVHHESERLKLRYFAMGIAIDRGDDPDMTPHDVDSILLYLFADRDDASTAPVGSIGPAGDQPASRQAA